MARGLRVSGSGLGVDHNTGFKGGRAVGVQPLATSKQASTLYAACVHVSCANVGA